MRAHTDSCGRTGSADVVVMNCKTDCACWCHKGCRLDVEIGEDNWQTLKAFDNLTQAESLARDLANACISAMVSYACYAYGECELCALGPTTRKGTNGDHS
jgi:hypothetical protein